MAEIRLAGLSKSFAPGSRVLDGIDLTIADRELMVLVGPSGCGKTTCLRCIAGLERADAGAISIGGRQVDALEPKDRDIAMVFQNYALYPHLTVRENLGFALSLRRTPASEIAARVGEAAAMLSLEPLLDRLPKQLSGGQRQRVAIGRAIVRRPQAFLFDEPLSNLDAKLRGEMRVELKTLLARVQATAVYVTHDQVEAMTLGDRIAVMHGGRLQQVADPVTVYDRPANRFVAAFIGSPAMNLISGVLERSGDDWQVAGITLPRRDGLDAHAGKPVTLGLRPERIVPGAPAGMPSRPARVVVAEVHGDRQVLHLDAGGVRLVCSCDAHQRLRPGETLTIGLDTTHAHLFAGTGDDAPAIACAC